MLEIEKLKKEEQAELMSIIQKNVEKSDLGGDKYYLFTDNVIDKTKIFLWCHRFLCGLYNILEPSNVRDVIEKEIKHTKEVYEQVNDLLYKIEKTSFNKNQRTRALREIVFNDARINGVIDAFAILLEKQNILSMSKLKGIILEGNSGKEFKRVFQTPVGDIAPPIDIEEIIEDTEELEETDEQTELDDIDKNNDLESQEKWEREQEIIDEKNKIDMNGPINTEENLIESNNETEETNEVADM